MGAGRGRWVDLIDVAAVRGGSIDLAAVLSAMTGRRVRIGEIITALDVGKSTYYEQRDDGRLVSADNLVRLAAEMELNAVELQLNCGLITADDVVDCADKLRAAQAEAGSARPARTRRFQRRPEAPPL